MSLTSPLKRPPIDSIRRQSRRSIRSPIRFIVTLSSDSLILTSQSGEEAVIRESLDD